MNWYLLLLKIDPNHTQEAVRHIQKLPKNPLPNVQMCNFCYVFGTWDACLWFQTNNHDKAMNFVQKYVRNIPWLTETYVMPTTTIKVYK
jgi:hypothetical protein